jgi:isopentenyldiphosphate isomerase
MNNIPVEEWFPVVDETGKEIGKAPRSVCHDGKSKFLHPVVHLHVLSLSGKLFLQKRASTKDIEPGKWDTSVGGHVDIGEKIDTALRRETYEELGITEFKPVFVVKYIWESQRERELVYSYLTITENIPAVNLNEIEEGKFWSLETIKDNLGKSLFTPNFEHEFKMIFETLNSGLTKKPHF